MLFTTTQKQLKVISTLVLCAGVYWAFTLPIEQVIIGASLFFLALVGVTEAHNGN